MQGIELMARPSEPSELKVHLPRESSSVITQPRPAVVSIVLITRPLKPLDLKPHIPETSTDSPSFPASRGMCWSEALPVRTLGPEGISRQSKSSTLPLPQRAVVGIGQTTRPQLLSLKA